MTFIENLKLVAGFMLVVGAINLLAMIFIPQPEVSSISMEEVMREKKLADEKFRYDQQCWAAGVSPDRMQELGVTTERLREIESRSRSQEKEYLMAVNELKWLLRKKTYGVEPESWDFEPMVESILKRKFGPERKIDLSVDWSDENWD